MQPARAHRIASQTIRAPCSAPPAPITSPPRIARSARRTPRTCSSARASQYFALVYLVRGTNFSKIQFIYILNWNFLSVRSSVGTELGNLAQYPGFDTGRKFSAFFVIVRIFSRLFYFRHFHQSYEKKNEIFTIFRQKKILCSCIS